MQSHLKELNRARAAIAANRATKSLADNEMGEDLHQLLDASEAALTAKTDGERIGAMTTGFARLAILETRKTMRLRSMIKQDVTWYMDANCPLQGASRKHMVFALMLKPWPWLFLSVAVFSPHAVEIIRTVRYFAAQ